MCVWVPEKRVKRMHESDGLKLDCIIQAEWTRPCKHFPYVYLINDPLQGKRRIKRGGGGLGQQNFTPTHLHTLYNHPISGGSKQDHNTERTSWHRQNLRKIQHHIRWIEGNYDQTQCLRQTNRATESLLKPYRELIYHWEYARLWKTSWPSDIHYQAQHS